VTYYSGRHVVDTVGGGGDGGGGECCNCTSAIPQVRPIFFN
jgi:hypothetical protein